MLAIIEMQDKENTFNRVYEKKKKKMRVMKG